MFKIRSQTPEPCLRKLHTAWRWVGNDWIFLFGWSVPLRPSIHLRCFFFIVALVLSIFTPKLRYCGAFFELLHCKWRHQPLVMSRQDQTAARSQSTEMSLVNATSLYLVHIFYVVNSSYPRCVKAFKTTTELRVTEELAKSGFVGRINSLFGVEILVGFVVTERNTEYYITCLCAQYTKDVTILSIHLNHFYVQHFLTHTVSLWRCTSLEPVHWMTVTYR